MKKVSTIAVAGSTLVAALLASVAPATVYADGYNNGAITIYFTRHAEKETVTQNAPAEAGVPSAFFTDAAGNYVMTDGISKGKRLDQVCGVSKCAETLSKKGQMRAMLLADWFKKRIDDDELGGVYATHKIRTQQTVDPTATAYGMTVQNVLAGGTELSPEGTTDSECATLDAIAAAREEGLDTIIVAGHSGTLYDIMGDGNDVCKGLGLDTSDNVRFPKDDAGKVKNFGDVWKVRVRPNGTAVFKFRKLLDFTRLSVTESVN